MTLKTLKGVIIYLCPKCGAANDISLENLENYIDVYDVMIPYGNGEHTSAIEFCSPKCIQCGESTTSFIKG